MATSKSLRIVFMGTPEFAVASLEALVDSGFNIVGVVTAPDKPAGRGMKLSESAVKKYASEKGLRLLQPEKLKNPAFIQELQSLEADLQVVVAFRMLPELVWSMPALGTINLHGSLLPQYRGAAPINWAVINGEKETGVTTFKLKHEIDTGNILLQQKFAIGPNDTAGDVHDKMKDIGAALLVNTVTGLAEDNLQEISQQSDRIATKAPLRHAPKITTETCKIDFNKTAIEVHNLIRGLSPFPAAFTTLNGKILKIYRTETGWPGHDATGTLLPAGDHVTDGKTFLRFACADGYISIKELQLEGKKRLLIEDFLRGYHFND